MTTLIFLDFDGVINNRETEKRPYKWPAWHDFGGTTSMLTWVCPKLIQKVEELRAWADADIVISSTWRLHYELEELRKILSPIPAERIVGVTPVANAWSSHTRGLEIQEYLHGDPRDRFVILDDLGLGEFLPDQRDKLAQTNDDLGITDEDVASAKKILDSQVPKL